MSAAKPADTLITNVNVVDLEEGRLREEHRGRGARGAEGQRARAAAKRLRPRFRGIAEPVTPLAVLLAALVQSSAYEVPEGFAVEPSITIPEEATSVTITPDGEVLASFNDRIDQESLGRISLVTFVNDKGLDALGGNLFSETTASGPPNTGDPGEDGRGLFRQGFLEESAVDAVREITELIEAQRAYEMNAKVVSAADQMLGATVQIR